MMTTRTKQTLQLAAAAPAAAPAAPEAKKEPDCCPGPKPDPGKEVLTMLASDPNNSQPQWQVKPHCPPQPVAVLQSCAETEADSAADSVAGSEAEDSETVATAQVDDYDEAAYNGLW